MSSNKFHWLVLFILFSVPVSCGSGEQQKKPRINLNDKFGEYWYQGKAELTSYELKQARYGQINAGHAVLIFVTEDFSKSAHVKLDNPAEAKYDAVKVLKLNFTKKFLTGIYPYSMMSSIFTPVYRNEFPHTLKITTSSQEWCGHTFTQLNYRNNKYNGKLYSYFESEGDQSISLPDAPPEDELWNLIRLDPSALPQGEMKMIPGTLYQRLSHEKLKAYKAKATLQQHEANENWQTYKLHYPDLRRTLKIHFKKAFPHEIEGWEATRISGFGDNAREMTTTATKKKRLKTDYWTKNNVKDSVLRNELGLP